jgi:hypothetical protein
LPRYRNAARLGHGEFLKWIKAEFGWQQTNARAFMQVHRQFKSSNFDGLLATESKPSASFSLPGRNSVFSDCEKTSSKFAPVEGKPRISGDGPEIPARFARKVSVEAAETHTDLCGTL